MKKPLIILIAGPTGAGKTTLSKILSRYYSCAYISEDELTRELFPDKYQNIEDFPDESGIVEDRLLEEIARNFRSKTSAIIDLININERFLSRIKQDFNDQLVLKVLYPSIEIATERDSKRSGWTSGVSAIRRCYRKYEELRPVIGQENYIDNSNLTPQKTLESLIACIGN